MFKQKGFKLRGKARLVQRTDADHAPLLAEIHKLGNENDPVRCIMEVRVEATEQILAPSYWLMPETTEEAQVQQAMETYGVRPKALK